ncbi:MAG: AAA family ATPase [Syntrophomonas sp.]
MSQHYPQVMVIIISVNDEIKNFKQAMMAGAKEYLVKPLSPEDLNSTIRKVAEINKNGSRLPRSAGEATEDERSVFAQENKLVTVFGPKGGVGRSTIITNLATALARSHKNRVGLIDLDVQFGDISVMMNLNPRKTISELMQEGDYLGQELLEEYMYERNGVHILAAPNKPELAELVSPAGVERIMRACRGVYDFTLVDTPAFIDENVLSALEMSDLVLLIVALDLPSIKNIKKGLDILRALKLMERTRLIINRSSNAIGIEVRDIERVLDIKVKAEIPSDGKLAVASLNQGIPFVKMNPRAAISKAVMNVLTLMEE